MDDYVGFYRTDTSTLDNRCFYEYRLNDYGYGCESSQSLNDVRVSIDYDTMHYSTPVYDRSNPINGLTFSASITGQGYGCMVSFGHRNGDGTSAEDVQCFRWA